MDQETGKKIQEIQIFEQSLQSILMQKQAFLMESEESEKALQELESSGEEVYKLIGQLLIKSDKTRVIEELKKKTGLLNLRIKNIEKQEQSLIEKLESLREDIAKTFNK
ncbi:MAG: prefoldin subunit beta [Nanoarchaeota archaeon]